MRSGIQGTRGSVRIFTDNNKMYAGLVSLNERGIKRKEIIVIKTVSICTKGSAIRGFSNK